MVFETDCKLVVNEIIRPRENLLEFGTIVAHFRQLLSSSPNFQVTFIRRQANLVAHVLARASIFSASHNS